MTTKDKLVFALYAATSVAIVANATVEIARNVKQERRERKNLKAVLDAEKTN